MKEAGLYNFDLRRNPTNYEMRKAREKYNSLKQVLQHPEQFTTITVSQKTANKIDAAKAKVKTKTGKVKLIIPNDGGTVKLNRDKTITKINADGSVKKKVYKGGKDFFKTAEKLFKKVDENDPFAKTYIMVSIGGNSPFERIFRSLAELQFYMGRWTPKDTDEDEEGRGSNLKERLMRNMNLVTVKSPNGWFNEKGASNGKGKKGKGKNSRH